MPGENSKSFQLSLRDLKSTIIYSFIIAIGLLIPLLPDVQAWLVVQ
jgi:hypothetical protein